MTKIVLSDVTNFIANSSASATTAGNNTAIEEAIENTLSRDGTAPNTMESDFDMNGHKIVNLPVATTNTEPVRYREFLDAILGTLEIDIGELNSAVMYVIAEDEGAISDDATDNSAAFSAMEAANPGKWIWLAAGIYRCDETLFKPIGLYVGPGRIRFTDPSEESADDFTWGGNVIPNPIWGPLSGNVGVRFPNIVRGMFSGGALNPQSVQNQANFIDGFHTANLLTGDVENNTYISPYTARYTTGGSYNTGVGFGSLQFADNPDRNTAYGSNSAKEALSETPWLIPGSDYYDPASTSLGPLNTRMFGGDDEVPGVKGWIDKFPGVIDYWFDPDYLPTIVGREITAAGRPKAENLPSISAHRSGNHFDGRDTGIHLSQAGFSSFVSYKCGAGLVKASAVSAFGKGAGQNAFYWSDSSIFGAYACANTVRIHQSVIGGRGALQRTASASNSVVLGFEAANTLGENVVMASIDDFTGVNHNVLIGTQVARKADTAVNCVLIGSQVVHTSDGITLDSDIIIGAMAADNIRTNVGYSETEGYRMIFGENGASNSGLGAYLWMGQGTLSAVPIISGDFDNHRVAINANPWVNALTSVTKDKYTKAFNVFGSASTDGLVAWSDFKDHGWNSTWDDILVTYTALKLNVTDTNSHAASLFMDLQSSGTSKFKVSKAGVVSIAGTQVLGPRDTGWTAMTGTPDEATAYATSTITLPQLAGRVAALQAALTTHGMIGA